MSWLPLSTWNKKKNGTHCRLETFDLQMTPGGCPLRSFVHWPSVWLPIAFVCPFKFYSCLHEECLHPFKITCPDICLLQMIRCLTEISRSKFLIFQCENVNNTQCLPGIIFYKIKTLHLLRVLLNIVEEVAQLVSGLLCKDRSSTA